MRRISFAVLFAIAMLIGAVATANATTSTQPTQDCVQGDCTFERATAVTGSSSSTFTTTTVTTAQMKESVRKFERRKNVIVAINMKPNGVQSFKGCVDPIKKGWIKAGGVFKNTRLNGSPFLDRWVKGIKICGAKLVKVSKTKWVMRGTKSNCANRNIEITVKGPKPSVKKVKKVLVFKTYKAFYRRHVGSITTTNVTTTVGNTTYVCPAGSEMVQKDAVMYCKTCPPPVCKPKCPPGNTYNPATKKCEKDGTSTPPTTTPGDTGEIRNPAPGPNPQPAPDDPTRTPDNPSGSWQCYSEETGQPVPARQDGTCPAGSFGSR